MRSEHEHRPHHTGGRCGQFRVLWEDKVIAATLAATHSYTETQGASHSVQTRSPASGQCCDPSSHSPQVLWANTANVGCAVTSAATCPGVNEREGDCRTSVKGRPGMNKILCEQPCFS